MDEQHLMQYTTDKWQKKKTVNLGCLQPTWSHEPWGSDVIFIALCKLIC